LNPLPADLIKRAQQSVYRNGQGPLDQALPSDCVEH